MNFQPAARLILSVVDSMFCTAGDGLRLFTWWNQVPGDMQSPYNVIAAAMNGPLKENAKAGHGFIERDSGREVFDVYRESINGRPFLPANRKPEHGHYFWSAMCIPGADGYPIDDDGNRLTIPPKDAAKYCVDSAETHLVAAHWHVEATPASS